MRRRLRRFVLIVGTTLCVLIAAAFVVSARWQFAYKYPRPNGPAVILRMRVRDPRTVARAARPGGNGSLRIAYDGTQPRPRRARARRAP